MLTDVSTAGFVLLKGVHFLSTTAIFVGLILFIGWALKNLKKDKLHKLSLYLLVGGILACFIVSLFGGYGYHKKFNKGNYDATKWCEAKCGK